jgi:Flp pilus assembly pilin Flp
VRDGAQTAWRAASIERMVGRSRPRDAGQSLAEYALIVALIVIVALVALTFFGTQINDILSAIADQIDG